MQNPVLEFKEIAISESDFCIGLYTEEQAKNVVKVGSNMGLNTELRTIRKIRGLKIKSSHQHDHGFR